MIWKKPSKILLFLPLICFLYLGCGKIWYAANSAPKACYSNYLAAVLQDGPTAYWRLNELSGNTAIDMISGNNATYNAGFLLGQPAGILGLFNYSAYAPSASTLATLNPPFNNLIFTANILTEEMWFKPTQTSQSFTLAFRNGGFFKGFEIGVNQAPCAVGQYKVTKFGAGPDICINGYPNDSNVWHYFALVANNSGMTVYLDGNISGTSANNSSYVNCDATCTLGIGNSGAATYSDDIALYTTALTQAQIQNHYLAGTSCE